MRSVHTGVRERASAELASHVLDVMLATEEASRSGQPVHVSSEAPNWHPDGRWIVVNGDGVLYRVGVDATSGLQLIPASGLPELNNDHLISRDGRWHYVSANDGHLYRSPTRHPTDVGLCTSATRPGP